MKKLTMLVLSIAVAACAGPQSRATLTPTQWQMLQLSSCIDDDGRHEADCNHPVPQAPLQPAPASAPLLPTLPALAGQNAGLR